MLRQLAAEADVLIENYKVGQLAKYGLDAASLRALNPRLIYCSITGYGQTGPDSGRPGYDLAIQAAGGLMSITGEREGTPGSEPQKVGVAVVDLMTGVYATTAILAALQGRHASGLGSHIDMALLDVQVAMLANQASNHLIGGSTPKRLGNAHSNIVPYQVFATRDGHAVVSVGNDAQFARFCQACGHPDVALDTRYATNAQRVVRRAELVPILAGWMLTRSTAEWMALLDEQGVPCAPILDIPQVLASPQVRARGLQPQFTSADGRRMPLVAGPALFDGERAVATRPPPGLDEHGTALRTALAAQPGWPRSDQTTGPTNDTDS
jgi:crotonobetainyl-CoA:carnitine CoA-transferase CaiB-like acyl-CoA transferase